MNKKVICLSAIFFVAILAMGAVSAANLENHNFDGHFSMKVPKGMTFEKQDESTNENGVEMVSLAYMSDSLAIIYSDTPAFSDYSYYYMYQIIFQGTNPDLTKCYESQEDNLRILEPTTSDDTHFAIVGTSSGNKAVLLGGSDVGLLKEMGHTIKFK